jgi:hypothetical protein
MPKPLQRLAKTSQIIFSTSLLRQLLSLPAITPHFALPRAVMTAIERHDMLVRTGRNRKLSFVSIRNNDIVLTISHSGTGKQCFPDLYTDNLPKRRD